MSRFALRGFSLGAADGSPVAATDRGSAIFAASWVLMANQMMINLQPLVIGTLGSHFGLSDRAVGQLGATYIGAIALATLSAPTWIRRVDWRVVTALTMITSTSLLLWGTQLNSAAQFIWLFCLLGLVKGLVGAPSFASLGDSSNPTAAYSISIVLQSIVVAIVATPMAGIIIPQYGPTGMFVMLAALNATGILICRWLAPNGRDKTTPDATMDGVSSGAPITLENVIGPLLALLALAIFTGGVLGFWYFAERIGAASGRDPAFIGMVFSAASIGNMFSSAFVAWLSRKTTSRTPILIGSAMLVAGLALVTVPGPISFAVANILFSAGWGIAQPAYWAVLRKVDTTDRLFVLAMAAQGGAGVVIGMAAGPVIEAGSYSGLMSVCVGLILAAAATLGLASTISNRLKKLSAPDSLSSVRQDLIANEETGSDLSLKSFSTNKTSIRRLPRSV